MWRSGHSCFLPVVLRGTHDFVYFESTDGHGAPEEKYAHSGPFNLFAIGTDIFLTTGELRDLNERAWAGETGTGSANLH